MRFCTAVVALGLVAWASTASADVKLVAQMSGKMVGRAPSGETVTYIKGHKMRTDQTMGGAQISTIVDLDAAKLTTINHKAKQFEVWNVADVAKAMKDTGEDPRAADVRLEPNGQTKEVAGFAAVGYDLNVKVATQAPNGASVTMNITGPTFLSTAAPGAREYADFYRTAADKGIFFGDPRAAKAQPGNARALMAVYQAMAEKGMPLESTHSIKLSGDGPMAGNFAKAGGAEITSTSTSVSDAPLGDDIFEVPAGYTRVGTNQR